MPYCPACGVEVENRVESCPLCNTAIPVVDESPVSHERLYPGEKKKDINPRAVLMAVWSVITILSSIAFLILLAVDLITNRSITWSGYAMTGIGFGWLLISILLFLFHKPAIIITGISIIITGMLVLLDIIDTKLDWFLVLGLPIVGMVAIFLWSVYLLITLLRRKAIPIIGFTFVLASVFCIGLDLLISGFQGHVYMSWSFIVMAVTLPLAAVFLIIHYYIARKVDIRKYFHL